MVRESCILLQQYLMDLQIIVIGIVFLSCAFGSYFFLKKKDLHFKVVDIDQLPNNLALVTLLFPKQKKLSLKPGQPLSLKIGSQKEKKSKKYYPMQITNNTLQILTNRQQKNINRDSSIRFMSQLQKEQVLRGGFSKSDFKYEGNSEIKVTFYDKKTIRKSVSRLFIIAEGTKISAAYHFLHFITKQSEHKRPQLKLLFFTELSQSCPLKLSILSLLKENKKSNCSFIDESKKHQESYSFAGILKDFYDGDFNKTFFIISMEDSCQAILSEKFFEGAGVPNSQILRL